MSHERLIATDGMGRILHKTDIPRTVSVDENAVANLNYGTLFISQAIPETGEVSIITLDYKRFINVMSELDY